MIFILNTNNLAVSEYSGITFTTLVEKDDVLYGIKSDGVYKFTGDDDSGVDIDCYIETGFLDFGSRDFKRFRTGSIYLGYDSDCTGKLTLYNSTDGVDDTDYYDVSVTADYPHLARPQVWDGMRAKYWKFKLENTNGANFQLRDFYVTPYLENRAIK